MFFSAEEAGISSTRAVHQYASVEHLPTELEQYRTQILQGERLLAKGTTKSLIQTGKPALQYMCQFRGLDSTGTRLDMANRLIANVRTVIHECMQFF
jgi:hypothetical protein